MITKHKKSAPHNETFVLLLKGLLIGKVLTLVVIGGVFWWMVRMGVFRVAYAQMASLPRGDHLALWDFRRGSGWLQKIVSPKHYRYSN